MILGFEASGWRIKIDEKTTKNGVTVETGLGIDFWSILDRFGEGLGRQNRSKTDRKNHRKNDFGKTPTKMAQEAQHGSMTPIDRSHFGRRGGDPP